MFEKNGIPLYVQLKDKILQDIKDNYKAGDVIPTESKLEERYQVSRITIRKAIEQLQIEDIVEKKQGKGTFVKIQKILYEANSIGSLTQRLQKQNHQLETKTIKFEIITKKHYVKELLQCDTILCIKRFRTLDNTPFALMLNYIDIDKVPNIEKIFKIESLYQFLKEQYKIEFYNAKEIVKAKNATKKEALKLGIGNKDALLSLTRLSYDKNNYPVEYSDILIRADMYEHKIILTNDKISNF